MSFEAFESKLENGIADNFVDVATSRIGYAIGASFMHTPVLQNAVGPRTGAWLQYLAAPKGTSITIEGRVGYVPSDYIDLIEWHRNEYSKLEYAGTWKIDWGLIGVSGQMVTDSAGDTRPYPTLAQTVTCIGKLKEFCKKVYCITPNPIDNRPLEVLFNFDGLTDEAFAEYRQTYIETCEAEGAIMIDAYSDWWPSGVLVPPWDTLAPTDGDYHLDPRSAYRAAKRILDTVEADYT